MWVLVVVVTVVVAAAAVALLNKKNKVCLLHLPRSKSLLHTYLTLWTLLICVTICLFPSKKSPKNLRISPPTWNYIHLHFCYSNLCWNLSISITSRLQISLLIPMFSLKPLFWWVKLSPSSFNYGHLDMLAPASHWTLEPWKLGIFPLSPTPPSPDVGLPLLMAQDHNQKLNLTSSWSTSQTTNSQVPEMTP